MRQRTILRIAAGVAFAGGAASGAALLISPATTPQATGQSIAISGFPRAMAVDAATGHVLIASASDAPSDTMLMLNATDGTVLRSIRLGRFPGPIVVAPSLRRAFVAESADNKVDILDTRIGTLIGAIPLDGGPGAIAVDGRTAHVFVTTSAGACHLDMLDGRRGTILHRQAIACGAHEIVTDERTSRAFMTSPNGPRGAISIVNTTTGAIMRTVSLGYISGAPTVDERRGHVFVGTVSGIVILDALGGAILRTVGPTAQPLAISVDRGSGAAFVLTGAWGAHGRVTMLDARRGRLLWTTTVGKNVLTEAIDERAHRLFVANQGDPSISVLDTRTGKVVHTVPMDASPQGVIVDAVTARAYVSTFGDTGGRPRPSMWQRLQEQVPWLPRHVVWAKKVDAGVSILDVPG